MKLTKQLSTLMLICTAILVAVLILPGKAEAAVVKSGTCGENLSWALDDEGTLTISGTGPMRSWTISSSIPWNNFRESIKNVVIEDGVTTICSYAFYQCSNLTTLALGNSITSIGNYAFNDCYSLNNVTIPVGVTTIGDYAFKNCRKMNILLFSNSVTTIGTEAFSDCDSLTSVTIPNSVTSIGNYAFSSCNNLSTITFGTGITTIVDHMFSNCYGLVSVTIPDNITTLEDYAFNNCVNLSSVTIGSGVSSISSDTFNNCGSLTGIWVDASNEAYSSDSSGVLFNKDKTFLSQAPQALSGSYIVPESVVTIDYFAFSYCSLTSITIPDSVANIRYAAFSGCNNLADVYYTGTQAQWDAITIGSNNSSLTGATIHIKRIAVDIEMGNLTQSFGSVSEAVENCEAGSVITLKDNTVENIVVSKDISLDLNGFAITGDITATDGAAVTLKDSSTDDYSTEGGYGKITGTVTGVEAAKGYMKITENGETSFHRLNLDTVGVTARAIAGGMYFNSQFGGDEVVKRNIVAYGTAMGAGKMPNFADKTYTRIDAKNWMTGCDTEGNSRNLANGTVLQGILGKNSGFSANVRNSQMQIYSQAYIELADGTRILGDVVCYSLRDVFEGTDTINGIDQIWNTLNDTQKQPVLQLYADFQRIMHGWNIPNIKAAAK